ncbi:hypothetical protein AA0472_1955 [Acetobacter estunensis NRIC 0472]|uniref:Uncharacterized protein n=1 Tax=Acetobacter estunensis TaxID=104097 RepID=A0A967B3W5_9PROT|nr:hypothetical protein [Acetobacter estunensis]NHO52438.1 hypothetical protein [Acetobacter estunensis]GBQ25988.1 hypothetical protein AA0472_1955 [Acetobacter estunensis NRIC 0472]
MDLSLLQQKISSGLTKAASIAGVPVMRKRPQEAFDPLGTGDSIALKSLFDMSASFPGTSPDTWGHVSLFASVNSDILVGDYLQVIPDSDLPTLLTDTYFVARTEPARPSLVIMTNAVISFLQSDSSLDDDDFGLRVPQGPVRKDDISVATGWPASMLRSGGGGKSTTDLGTDVRVAGWEILMPVIPRVRIHEGLRMQDEHNNFFHVCSVEQTPFGLRIEVTADQT